MEDEIVEEAVEATRAFSQERERTRFVVQLPQGFTLPVVRATIRALCGNWERVLLVSDEPIEGLSRVERTTHTGLLSQVGLFTHLFVTDARGAYTPLYRQFAAEHLHPFGLAVAYTSHYHEEERKGLTGFFRDRLCYFSEEDTAFIDEEMRRGLKFYKMACKDRLVVKMHPVATSVSARQVFAQDTYEQTVVWDEIA